MQLCVSVPGDFCSLAGQRFTPYTQVYSLVAHLSFFLWYCFYLGVSVVTLYVVASYRLHTCVAEVVRALSCLGALWSWHHVASM